MCSEGADRIASDAIPSAEERELLRYYYYIKHGVDTIHVAPLDQTVLDRVLALVPAKLKRWSDVLLEAVNEVREDFMLTMKKAIVDYVLQDPSFVQAATAEVATPLRKELVQLSAGWKAAAEQARLKLERSLHVTNPCLAVLLDLWYSNFRKLRLVRTEEFVQHRKAYELQEFQATLKKHIIGAKKVLMEKYYAGVVDVFLIGNKKNRLPNPALKRKMKRFYDAVATIMTYQLQTLCLKSLHDYTEYITDIKVIT